MKKEKIYGICVWVLIIDQIVKILVTLKMKLHQSIAVIPNFLDIYYVRNKGAAFSILNNMRYLFISIALICFFLLYKYISKNNITKKLEIVSLGLLMGGLVGNLIDRLIYGYVIDYISFTIFKYNFPVFNIADIAIVTGCFLLVIDIFKIKK